ncbi:MAG: carboxypeptidase-like regulatory domain-containing protein [Bacteroidota bacterium]
MKKLIFLFIVFGYVLSAQQTLRAVLIDSISKQAIEFANIGVLNKGVGTVSNEKGEFVLTVPDSLTKHVLRISMIGYKTKNFNVSDLQKLTSVFLSPIAISLNEVSVTSKKAKFKIVGNDTRTEHVSAGFTTNNLGTELAVKLNIKHKNTQLRKFMVNIISNDKENPAFRFNVYKVSKNGEPGENILKENVIIHVEQMPCFIELDLTPFFIYTDEDVYISIEWIKALKNGHKVMFSSKLIGSQTYFKNASQDKWEKLPSIGVGLHAEIGY